MLDLSLYKIHRNKFKSMCKQKKSKAKKQKRLKLIDSRTDPKMFWSLINSSVEKTQSENYIEHETWYKHFKNLLNKESSHEAVDARPLNLNFIPTKSITNDEIIQNIRSLDDKSPGPDCICAEMYKYVLHDIFPFFNKLSNEIFDTSNIPEE